MGFPITTRTIIVIIDYDWADYFLYFFHIFLLYFSKPIKIPPLSRKRASNLGHLFPLFGFSKWKSIFRVIRSVIKLL